MAQITLPIARLLYAMALADRVLRIASAERVAAEHELTQVTQASAATIAWARGLEATVRAAAKLDDAEWIDALGELMAGMDSPDDAAAIRALGSLQRRLGSTPAFTDVAGFLRACAGDGPVILGATRSTQSSRRGPTPAALNSLGTACTSPFGSVAETILAALVSDPHERWAREHAGLHIAINRTGKLHDHHGIGLGDGSVVHFNGEPGGRSSEARVVRESLHSILELDDIARAHSLHPHRADGAATATLDPAVTCLRALSRLGDAGYEVVRNNCEHFSTSAQLGAPLSFQSQAAQGLVLPQTQAHRDAALVLSRQLGFSRTPLPDDMLMNGADDAYPIDLARAYWSRDREEVLIWFPIWSENGVPLDSGPRSWCVGSLDASDWHATAPALDLDPNWHASLVSIGGTTHYWLTSEGNWLQEHRNVTAIVEQRLRGTRALLETLVAPPSAFAQKCADVAESLVRRSSR